jgi:hypothetical protein
MLKVRPLIPTLALLGALTALPARAVDPKPADTKPAGHPAMAAEKPLPPASKSATDLARILATKESWNQGVDGLTRMVMSQFSGHPGSSLQLPPGFEKKVHGEVEAILPYETLVDLHARQLGAAYTEPELNELLTHYRSPVGQKWLKTMPDVSQKVALDTQKQVDPKLGELMSRLAKEVKPPAGAKADGKASPAAAKKAPAAKK